MKLPSSIQATEVSMLGDLEMTRLCARAMGHRVMRRSAVMPESAWMVAYGREGSMEYDPLHDDAQAMALVKRFKIAVYRYSGKWAAERATTIGAESRYSDNPDLNRAIVERVARMQAAKVTQIKERK